MDIKILTSYLQEIPLFHCLLKSADLNWFSYPFDMTEPDMQNIAGEAEMNS